MRTVRAHLDMSLDGVVEHPERWAHTYFLPEMVEAVQPGMEQTATVLFGRRTYEEFAAVWPRRDPETAPFARFLNETNKLVASNTLTSLEWGPAELISGDVVQGVAGLKREPGADVRILGSITLVGSLLRAGLLDALEFRVYPIVLGAGKRLFEGPDAVPLKLVDSGTFSNGVLSLGYAPA